MLPTQRRETTLEVRGGTGRYVDYPDYGHKGHRTTANMYLTLLHLAGAKRGTFGMPDPSPKALDAFDIQKEPEKVRAKFGVGGTQFLQARRLVEAAVQVVTLTANQEAKTWHTQGPGIITARFSRVCERNCRRSPTCTPPLRSPSYCTPMFWAAVWITGTKRI